MEGGTPLVGVVRASGSKNAALPILIASILAPGEHRFTNVPDLADTSSALSLLGRIGCPSLAGAPVRIDTSRVAYWEAPYDVVRKMRASVLVLGPLLARCGQAVVSMPGGCAIGTRPIDQHLKGLEALGCRFRLEGGNIHGEVDDLRGADIHLDMPTVTGTENILMAAVLARGTTRLHNAAREPEVMDLCRYLITLGAQIDGIGTGTLHIEGASRLTPASRPYRIIPDRIETGTWLCAAAATRGDITVVDTDPQLLGAVVDVLRRMGAEVEVGPDWIRLRQVGPSKPIALRTEPYPGFPTDMQAQVMALCTVAEGSSTLEETIFENRFLHAAELRRMGARIDERGGMAIVHGGPLSAASVMASDLRASAALVIAALATPGLTEILRIYHLDRGYDDLVGKARALGARIARVSDAERDPDAMLRATQAPLLPAA